MEENEHLRVEVIDALFDLGRQARLRVIRDVPVTWNALAAADATVDVAWFSRKTGRMAATWVIADPVSRWTGVARLSRCPAAVKVEIGGTAEPTTSVLRLSSRDLLPHPTCFVHQLVSAALELVDLLCHDKHKLRRTSCPS